MLKVYFFDRFFDGNRWWFKEVNQTPARDYPRELTRGFSSSVLRSKGPLGFYLQISRILMSDKPRAVLFFGYYLWQHWLLWLACKKARTAVLFVGETFDFGSSSPRRFIKSALLPLFLKSADRILTIGEKNRNHYLGIGIKKERLVDARYCVDNRFFSASPEEARQLRNHFRSTHAIAPDAFVLLFVGRLFHRKRPRDVLAIHRALLQEHPAIHTCIVGSGEMENELRAMADKLPRIVFVGFQDQAFVRQAYHASDCLIVPSRFETWGLVVNEAFNAGVPAVVTENCGAAGDLVVNGETGFVYSVGDTARAAQLITQLAGDGSLHARMALQCKTKVQKHYDCGSFAEAILCALRAV
jgi:glycosyltransferase involved in cell wall biosynthesis